MQQKPQTMPTSTPMPTSGRRCWRRIRREVQTAPHSKTLKQSQLVGLKRKMSEKAVNAPTTPPAAAACVLILIQLFSMAQTTCITNAPAISPNVKRGILAECIR